MVDTLISPPAATFVGDEILTVEALPPPNLPTSVSEMAVANSRERSIATPQSMATPEPLGAARPQRETIATLPSGSIEPQVEEQAITGETFSGNASTMEFQRYEPAANTGNTATDAFIGEQLPLASRSMPSSQLSGNGEGLSIIETVQRAIAWHPSIGEALGRLYQQGEQVSVAKSGYFPQISAGVSTERRSSSNRSEDAFTVSASQMLYDFGRISSEVEAAGYGVDRDQARVWLAMDQLAREASQAAIEVQRNQALSQIAREQIAGIDDIRQLAQQRSALGASTRSDEIQAQSRLEAAEATELQIIAQLNTWKNTVRTLIGASGPVEIKQDFPQPLIQSCALASDDFDNVPELLVAEAQQAEARAIIAQTQASFFPTVSLDAGLNQFLNRDLAEDDTDVVMRVNLSSNLYQGGATSARRRAADYSLQASQAAKDAAYLSLSRSLSIAKEQTASFGLRLATLDARSRSIRETQQLYRQQYLALGTRSLLDLLNAEQEIHQSRFDQENTRYDLYSLQMDCLYSAADIREAFNLDDSMVQGVSVLQ
ncbi:TolC family outer membrane protein [Halomonas sp. MC140]|nr:TolC family outer membrane protein [Halomonas sp. MC140]MDN7132928.1 TolC family outer membrane protein [Halomonas sp. MC140]